MLMRFRFWGVIRCCLDLALELSVLPGMRILQLGMLALLSLAFLCVEPVDLTAQVLVIERGAPGSRSAVQVDPVQYAFAIGSPAPAAGDAIEVRPGKTVKWKALKGSGGDKAMVVDRALSNGYVWVTHVAPESSVMILAARAHSMVLVNGEPRMGDPYANGSVSIPIRVRKGENRFLFACGRGELAARLELPAAPGTILSADATLPDLIRDGEPGHVWGAVVVSNNTTNVMEGHRLRVGTVADAPVLETLVPDIAPVSVGKVPIRIPATQTDQPSQAIIVELLDKDGGSLSKVEFTLAVKNRRDTHRRTFVSGIDESVQYYSVVPASAPDPAGMVLSLHGASVEASGQAACYTPLPWADVVCPTNRRAFGFDWEDWGTLDALEVLDHATARQPSLDKGRVHVTGHSMGGHGTWVLATMFPTRFAAAGPCASWPSFWQYGNAPEFDKNKPFAAELTRATSPYRTLDRVKNLAPLGVYILHGDADETVPVDLARSMRKALAEFHGDFAYREHPGGGHWYGNDSVADPRMLDFFRMRSLSGQKSVRLVLPRAAEFSIVGLAGSTFVQQRALEMTSISLDWDEKALTLKGTTSNCLGLALVLPPAVASVALDGSTVEIPSGLAGKVKLIRAEDGAWSLCDTLSAKTSGFKSAFDRRFVLVYGTKGTPEENAWAFAKARYDAEQWWYRGNGTTTMLSDSALDRPETLAALADRGVILYGHSDMNSAWMKLAAPDAPARMSRGKATVGDRAIEGDDLFGVFLAPRASGGGPLGVVAGSGTSGMRAADRLTYFSSGTGFPDALIGRAGMLLRGQEGIEAAEFFDNGWRPETTKAR